MDIVSNIEVAEKNLARVLELIKISDTKCNFLIIITLSMSGILIDLAASKTNWLISNTILVIISGALLLIILAIIFSSSFPQTKGPDNSLIYPEAIIKLKKEKFVNKFKLQKKESYLSDLLCQCYRNSQIYHIKYSKIKLAYKLLIPGALAWLVSIYMLK